MDGEVLRLALTNELHEADFVFRSDGGCRLNPHLAGRVVRAIAQIWSTAECAKFDARTNRSRFTQPDSDFTHDAVIQVLRPLRRTSLSGMSVR